jgi:hypothetical protein
MPVACGPRSITVALLQLAQSMGSQRAGLTDSLHMLAPAMGQSSPALQPGAVV